MATPTFNLPTSGSDPKLTTKEDLESSINQVVEQLDEARIAGDKAIVDSAPITVDIEDGVLPFSITDEDGYIGFGFSEFLEMLAPICGITEDSDQVLPLAITDEDGYVLLGADLGGTLFAPSLELSGGGSGVVSDNSRAATGVRGDPRLFDYNHFQGSGQSLMASSSGTNPFSTDPDLYSFTAGINIDTSDTGNTFAALPTSGASSVMRSAMNQLQFLIEGDVAYVDGEVPILASTWGVSGYALSQLIKGTAAYANGMWQAEEARRISEDDGKSHAVQSLTWMQGEASDDRLGTTEDYKTVFLQMVDDYQADVEATTNQGFDVPILTYQIASDQSNDPSEPTVARAYYEMAEERDDIAIFSPMYMFPYTDDYHLTAAGYTHLGLYLGKVLYRTVYRDEAWKALGPTSIRQSNDRVVVAKFHVPVGRLVFDTDTVDDPSDKGFVLTDTSGVVPLSTVEIINSNTVRISCSRDITGAARLSYAWTHGANERPGPDTGPRGCLRDEDPTLPAVSMGVNLWNWCVRFDLPVE